MMAVAMPVMEDQLHEVSVYPLRWEGSTARVIQHKMSLKVSGTKGYKLLVNDDH